MPIPQQEGASTHAGSPNPPSIMTILTWWLDLVGPLPQAFGHHFIIIVIDYFTKWIKVKALQKINAMIGVDFIKHNITLRFSISSWIVTDNDISSEANSSKHTVKT